MPENKKQSLALWLLLPFAGIFFLLGICIFLLAKPSSQGYYDSNLIAACFSLSGVFIFAATLFYQIKEYKLQIEELKKSVEAQTKTSMALEEQKEIQRLSQFEATFFNLLKTQQYITNNIQENFQFTNENSNNISDMFITNSKMVSGRNFFFELKKELTKIFNSINSNTSYKNFNPADSESIRNKVEELEKHSLYNEDFEFDNIKEYINLGFTNYYYQIPINKWKEIKEKDPVEQMKTIYYLIFWKYHNSLGHYFRHLYHIILFTDNFFEENQSFDYAKKKYIDFIQAQMSSYELTITFYNALAFPTLMHLIIKHNFLENLAIEDLIYPSHVENTGVILKSRKAIIGV